MEVRAGEHVCAVDEPQAFGGGGAAPSPGQLALASLGTCVALTYRTWAARMALHIDTLSVRVEGDIDVRGFLGADDDVRAGFHGVRVVVSLTGPPKSDCDGLSEAVAAHCLILEVFRIPVATEVVWEEDRCRRQP